MNYRNFGVYPLMTLVILTIIAVSIHADIEGIRQKAEAGDKEAQKILAQAYLKGDGIKQSYNQADKWFRKAAGMASVGIAVVAEMMAENEDRREDGNYPDKSNAMRVFISAADSGLSQAQFVMGGRYYDGFGVKRDFKEAARWFRLAAEQDHIEAQYQLGQCYEFGRGVTKDGRRAVKWFSMAANQGQVHSIVSLSNMYEYGHGIPIDYELSFKWLLWLAERGYSGSQCRLGYKYRWGRGVPVDKFKAYIWLNLAAAAGHGDLASEERDELEESMSLEQILKAQKVCREWEPKRDSL